MCAQALAAFDISKCVENGVEVTPEFNLVGEIIAFVIPFSQISIQMSLLTCLNCLRSKATRHLSNVRSNLGRWKLKLSFAKSFRCQNRSVDSRRLRKCGIDSTVLK
jgi:hypothetical protein